MEPKVVVKNPNPLPPAGVEQEVAELLCSKIECDGPTNGPPSRLMNAVTAYCKTKGIDSECSSSEGDENHNPGVRKR